jgi:hypothetical protein
MNKQFSQFHQMLTNKFPPNIFFDYKKLDLITDRNAYKKRLSVTQFADLLKIPKTNTLI